jgi:hypothetical protein
MDSTKTDAPADPRQVAERLLGNITWINDYKGYCGCPGQRTHTIKSGPSDCIVYLNGAPTVFCLHQSCREQCRQSSGLLRDSLRGLQPNGGELNLAQKKEWVKETLKLRRLEQRAHFALPSILKKYPWPYDTIRSQTVSKVSENAESHWWDLLKLFEAGDVIWIGEKYDSGGEVHQANFLLREEWLNQSGSSTKPFICPCSFKNSSVSRCDENLLHRRFLVVESDILSRDQVGSIFRWMREEVGMTLRAVVDTAGKSLHGWFNFPTAVVLEELKIMLPHMACDPGLFRPSQPVRLPGALRDGRFQKLIFLDNGGQS